MIRRALLPVLACALLVACGARPATPTAPSIAELRRRAADRPSDPEAQRALALGELLYPGGDPARARAQIDRALALAPHDPRLLLVAAVERDVHGDPAAALDGYFDALDAASSSSDALAPAIAEVAASSIEDLSDVAPGFAERVHDRGTRTLAASRTGLGPAAIQTLHELLLDLAFRRGDLERARTLARAAGCIPEWTVAGPFGPRELLGFDRELPAQRPGPLAAEHDLGPGRGVRPVRTVVARGCSAHFGGGPVPGGGTTIAKTTLEVPADGDYVLRLETPNSVEVFVDGTSVARLDARSRPQPRVTFHALRLAAGRRELGLKLGTRHPNPIVILGVTTRDGRALADAGDGARGASGTFADVEIPGHDGFAVYLRTAIAMARGDFVRAREAVRRSTEPRDASSALLVLHAAAALSHPLRSDDVRRDDGRALLRRAARRDPLAWYPALQLPRLEAAESQAISAIGALRDAATRWPAVIGFPLALADLLQARGWEADADQAVARARAIAPDACIPLKAEADAARRRGRTGDVERLSEALVRCDARSDARFSVLVRARRWDEAQVELARLDSFEPPSARFGILSARLDLARNRGDDAVVDATLRELAAQQPRNDGLALQLVDRLLAQGRTDDARRLADEVLLREPAAMSDLRRIRAAIGGLDDLAPYRLDGARVIREFEASGRQYDQPKALILDYTVVRVYPDGSTLELTHNIVRIGSEDAADDEGEFSVPEGARVLRLHTVKADGRRLEPDIIEGKDTISLPSLAPGDYVEFEYVRAGSPASGFPGGYLGDRFYFQSFETPFDRSELTIVMPRAMQPVVDPRGPAPRLEERVEGDLRVLHFLVRESRPLAVEPLSVSSREYIPSVNVGVGATWERFVEGTRDVLADRDVWDPAAERLVREVLGDAATAEPIARARRIYAWLLANVEDDDNFFGLAPAMLATRNGNRTRLLRYMLALAGVPSDIVLVRAKSADSTESELADGDTYEGLLVRVGRGDDAVWLATGERGAPFGYLPPLLRGQDALVLAEGAPFVRVPAGADDADRRTLDVDVQLHADGGARIDVTETYRGMGAVLWRTQLESIAAEELERRFEEGYVARLVPGATLASLRITGRETPEEPLVFEYSFDVSALGRRSGDAWAVPGLFPSRLAASYARLPARVSPQLLPVSTDVEVTVRLALPDATPAPRLLPPVQLRGPGGITMAASMRREGALVVSSRRVRVPIGRVSPSDYGAFAALCRSVDEAEARELLVALSDR